MSSNDQDTPLAMATIESIAKTLAGEGPITETGEDFVELAELITDIQQGEAEGAQALEELGEGSIESIEQLIDVAFGEVFTAVENDVAGPIRNAPDLDPDNVEQVITNSEGAAIEDSLVVLAALYGIEIMGLGQLESGQELVAQFMSFTALEDVLGRKTAMLYEKGVDPALEARVARQTRTEFVDLQDAIEQDLRNKDSDTGYIDGMATYGIREDNVPILEEVALQQIEFEELLETPAELGKVVPDDVLQAELDRAGYAEDTKAFLAETAGKLPRSARTYQELLVTEELVRALDTLAKDGVLTPQEAVDRIPDEVEADMSAFVERFELLRDLPAGTPSGTDFEGAFASGYLSLDELRDRLDQTDYPTDEYEAVLRKQVLDELDGDLQTALGLGLIGEGEYSDIAAFAGLDDETVAGLLQGQALDDIATARLQEEADPGAATVGTLVGIGESRARGLDGAGIETIADMAQADVETVVEAAQVSDDVAKEFIQQAAQRIQ